VGKGAGAIDDVLPVLDMVFRGIGFKEGIAPVVRGLDPSRAAGLEDAARGVVRRAASRGKMPPIPTEGPVMVQGNLLTKSGDAQNFTGGRRPFVGSSEVPLTPTARSARGLDPAVVPVSRRPAPGQTDLFGGGIAAPAPRPEFSGGPIVPAPRPEVVQYSPAAKALAESDPGTFSAIRQMAARAEDYYGIPTGGLVNDLISDQGTNVLRGLEQGLSLPEARAAARGSIVPSPAGQVTKATPGGSLAGAPEGALVRSPGGVVDTGESFTNIPVDVSVVDPELRQLAAAVRASNAGVQMGDLSRLASVFRNGVDPRVGLAAGAAATGLGLNAALSSIFGGQPGSEAEPKVMFRDSDGAPLGAVDDSTVRAAEAAAQRGATDPSAPGRAIVTRGDGGASARREAMAQADPLRAKAERALEPRDPSDPRYKGDIAKYYSERAEYARNPLAASELVDYAKQQFAGKENEKQLIQWAMANPELVYEMQRKANMNQAANQQSGESVTTTQVTSPMGPDVTASAIGNSEAVAQEAVTPSRIDLATQSMLQKAREMRDATRPQVQPRLQTAEQAVRSQPLF